MDVLPMCSIFQELQIVHDTGYFSALPSLEEYWQQVNISTIHCGAFLSQCLSLCGKAELSTYHASFAPIDHGAAFSALEKLKDAVITVVNTGARCLDGAHSFT